jgi:hypothetical protein
MSTVRTIKNRVTANINPFLFKEIPAFRELELEGSSILFTLQDDRIIKIPVSWIPGLKNASKKQLLNYSIQGHFVFWDDLDEAIGVKNLLDGSIVPKEHRKTSLH